MDEKESRVMALKTATGAPAELPRGSAPAKKGFLGLAQQAPAGR